MDAIEVRMPSYPALQFVAQHGRSVVFVLAVVTIVGGAAWGFVSGAQLGIVAWLLAGVAVFAIGRVLVELVELITDMLLPK